MWNSWNNPDLSEAQDMEEARERELDRIETQKREKRELDELLERVMWDERAPGFAAPRHILERMPSVGSGELHPIHVRAVQVSETPDGEQIATLEANQSILDALHQLDEGGNFQALELPGLSGHWVVYATPAS